MPLEKETRIYKTFLISTTLTTALILLGIFLVTAVRINNLVNEEQIDHARTLFDGIVLTRKWNAVHGGVFVEKKDGVISNPFLRAPDIEAKDGKIYTKRNPAVMTKEISELAQKEGKFRFRITSLNPLNPDNRPEAFEQKALRLFETGAKEVSETEVIEDVAYFRYMAPLYVSEECMACHAYQGYKLGDVRGGISVTFNINDVQRKLFANTILIAACGATTTALLLSLIWYFTARLTNKVSLVRSEIEKQARMDYLTKLFNRRYLIERFKDEFERARRLGRGLGYVMLDIDHFKRINDDFGHQAGDEILKEVAAVISASIRPYDLAGRFGGEEFIVILAEADLASSLNFAERLRESIKQRDFSIKDGAAPIHVTMSLGVAVLRDGDATVDDVIKRADEALYTAKRNGRDRVCHNE